MENVIEYGPSYVREVQGTDVQLSKDIVHLPSAKSCGGSIFFVVSLAQILSVFEDHCHGLGSARSGMIVMATNNCTCIQPH